MLLRMLLPVALVISATAAAALPLERIRLPEGFTISVYAEGVVNARQMALGENGTLFVGSRSAGNVYALVDRDGDQRADKGFIIDRDLRMPTGVAFRDGALYVGAVSQILRYDDIEARLDHPPEPVVVKGDLPRDTHHGWKYLGFGPDGKLYVPIGAPCNVCEPPPPFATIQRLDADGGNMETYASGVRNSVGFAFHPETGDLWFSDNGRDSMGDNLPPGELNHAPAPGLHFGYPYCHGGSVVDPRYGGDAGCDGYEPPAQALGPHVAPLGLTFYSGDMFPPAYRNQVFIAEHGSWDRSAKIGYRVVLVRLNDAGKAISYEPFAEGWLQGQSNWGRPADVLVMPDGALLIADDQAGAIYRIAYGE